MPRMLGERGYVSLQTGKWWEGSYKLGGFTHGMMHGDPKRGGRHGEGRHDREDREETGDHPGGAHRRGAILRESPYRVPWNPVHGYDHVGARLSYSSVRRALITFDRRSRSAYLKASKLKSDSKYLSAVCLAN